MTTAILDDQTVKIRARREIALRAVQDFGNPDQLGIFHALSPQEKWIPKPSYLLHEHTQDLPGTVGAFCDLFQRVDEASSAYKNYSVQMKRTLAEHAASVESVPNTPPVIAKEILAAISPTLTAWPSIDACLARLTDASPDVRSRSADMESFAKDYRLLLKQNLPSFLENLFTVLTVAAANPEAAVAAAEYVLAKEFLELTPKLHKFAESVSGNQTCVDALQGIAPRIILGTENAYRLSRAIIASAIGHAFDTAFSLFKHMTEAERDIRLLSIQHIDDAVGAALIEPLRNDICMDRDRKILTMKPYERETFLRSARILKEELHPNAYDSLTNWGGLPLKQGQTFRLFSDNTVPYLLKNMVPSLPRYQMALGMASVAFYQGRLLQSQIVGNRIGWKPFAKITG